MDALNAVRNGAEILLCLRKLARDGNSDLQALCSELGIVARDPETNTVVLDLCEHLKQMRDLGMLDFTLDDAVFPLINGPITITAQWTKIQTALGKPPLKGISRISSYATGIVLEPVFGRPKSPQLALDLFVLMPFTAELKPVYDNHIKKVAKKLKVSIRRGDDIFSANPIMEDIWSDVYAARLLIADCTGRNANVFYEIGIAHTVGKPVVLITQNKDDMPFDIKHFRYIEYSYSPEGIKLFEKTLESTLKEALQL